MIKNTPLSSLWGCIVQSVYVRRAPAYVIKGTEAGSSCKWWIPCRALQNVMWEYRGGKRRQHQGPLMCARFYQMTVSCISIAKKWSWSPPSSCWVLYCQWAKHNVVLYFCQWVIASRQSLWHSGCFQKERCKINWSGFWCMF